MTESTCVSCGRPVSENDRFCPGCGTATAVIPTSELAGSPPSAAPGGGGAAESGGATDASEAPTMVSHVSLQTAMAKRLVDATAGEFEILRELGHGAMGAVYLARDISLSRRVAIKVVAPHLLSDEGMISRFRLEAQTIASLRHPNIVNIHAVRQSDDLHYFVMEFIDGPTLRTIVKGHAPLEVPVVQNLIFQMGSALSYAHRAGRGVIHRDVKPANIMVDHEGAAFLTDFGISKISESTGLTQTGATIGTPEYMSPEQCRGENLTGASDQYALGIVAYEMLTGHTPYTGNQYQIMMAHTSGQARPSLLETRPDCPEFVAEAVDRMLAKEPQDRFPDLDTAAAAMGGEPLGYRDPVRLRIIELTGQREGGSDVDVSSPLSPTPHRRGASGTGPRSAGTGPRSAGTGPRSAGTGPRSAGTGQRSGGAAARSGTGPRTTTAASLRLVGVPEMVAVGASFALKADVRGDDDKPLPSSGVQWSSTDPAIAVIRSGRFEAVSAGMVSISASYGKVATSVQVTVTDPDMTAVGTRAVRKRPTALIAAGVVVLLAAGGYGAFTFLQQDGTSGAGDPPAALAGAGAVGQAAPPADADAGAPPTGAVNPPPASGAGAPPTGGASGSGGTTASSGQANPPAGPPPAQVAANPTASSQPTTQPPTTQQPTTQQQASQPPANQPAANTPPPPATPPAVARVDAVITNPSMTIGGGTQLATAQAFSSNGTQLSNPITWVSRSPPIATVNPSGQVTAVSAGTAWIVATSGGVRDSVQVTVAAPAPTVVAVESVAIDDPDFSIEAGASRVLTAAVTGTNQRLLDRPVRWSSANPAVATVDATSGQLTAVAAGTTVVTATSEGILDRVSVTVTPPPVRLPTAAAATPLIQGYVSSLSRGDRTTVLGYWPEGAGDPARRTELNTMMGATAFMASMRPSPGAPVVEGGAAVAIFQVNASYRSGLTTVSRTLTFRAEFQPAGSDWRLGTVTLTGVQD